MFESEFSAVANAAQNKVNFMRKNPVGYLVMAMLAGIFVGVGVLLAFTIGGQLSGQPYAKMLMGASFSVALSLVVMAGSELFTGNNMVLFIGTQKETVLWQDVIVLWVVCWIGNAVGSVLLAFIYHMTGLCTGAVAETMAAAAVAKMSAAPQQLLTRGILCNFLVCIAVWCATKCKTESGKLIMIFWCILAFFTTGFEHSVANMTLLTVALLNPAGQALTISGWFYNLLWVTLGNMFGGILLAAVPYTLAQPKS